MSAYQPPDPIWSKCWADASLPNGDPSGESCNRVAVSKIRLCADHYAQIVGRVLRPQAAA